MMTRMRFWRQLEASDLQLWKFYQRRPGPGPGILDLTPSRNPTVRSTVPVVPEMARV